MKNKKADSSIVVLVLMAMAISIIALFFFWTENNKINSNLEEVSILGLHKADIESFRYSFEKLAEKIVGDIRKTNAVDEINFVDMLNYEAEHTVFLEKETLAWMKEIEEKIDGGKGKGYEIKIDNSVKKLYFSFKNFEVKSEKGEIIVKSLEDFNFVITY